MDVIEELDLLAIAAGTFICVQTCIDCFDIDLGILWNRTDECYKRYNEYCKVYNGKTLLHLHKSDSRFMVTTRTFEYYIDYNYRSYTYHLYGHYKLSKDHLFVHDDDYIQTITNQVIYLRAQYTIIDGMKYQYPRYIINYEPKQGLATHLYVKRIFPNIPGIYWSIDGVNFVKSGQLIQSDWYCQSTPIIPTITPIKLPSMIKQSKIVKHEITYKIPEFCIPDYTDPYTNPQFL